MIFINCHEDDLENRGDEVDYSETVMETVMDGGGQWKTAVNGGRWRTMEVGGRRYGRWRTVEDG